MESSPLTSRSWCSFYKTGKITAILCHVTCIVLKAKAGSPERKFQKRQRKMSGGSSLTRYRYEAQTITGGKHNEKQNQTSKEDPSRVAVQC